MLVPTVGLANSQVKPTLGNIVSSQPRMAAPPPSSPGWPHPLLPLIVVCRRKVVRGIH